MIHEASLQEETSQRQTCPLQRIGSQASQGNQPGRVSWYILSKRAKHELTLLLIIVRACTGLHSLQRHSICIISWVLTETPWTERAGITIPVLQMKMREKHGEGGLCPRSHRATSKQDSGCGLQALSSASEFRESMNFDGKKKKQIPSLYSLTSN